MRSKKQKIQLISIVIGLAVLLAPSFLATAPVQAAAKGGTCVLARNQGQAAQKVATCKSFMPGGKDSTGKKFNTGKCYELSEERGSVSISRTISCSDSRLTANKATCPDGSLAPSNKTANCTAAHGGTVTTVSSNDDPAPNSKNYCGSGDDRVGTSINFGCSGKGNPILDLSFAIIRFLSNGVGLVVVGSIVFAGIQYTVSRADPQAVAAAQTRIRSSVIALIIYIFAYAILNYVIPKGFLHQ